MVGETDVFSDDIPRFFSWRNFLLDTSYLLQIWDAAYLHGDQWVVFVTATETWNFIFAE